jgi:hypothetical protein
MPLTTLLRPLTNCGIPAFAFAGFVWPRYVATLPAGPLSHRLAARKCAWGRGSCYHAPPTRETGGRGFYWAEAGERPFGLRAETVGAGWRAGDDVITGFVATLPKGRGWLVGWTMGEGMASTLDTDIFDDEADARRVAVSRARDAADREAEYQAEYQAALDH